MGYRRAGLGFQDSCPGTWGKGGLGDRRGGTAAADELRGRTGGRPKERDLLAGTAPVKPGRSGSKQFPLPEGLRLLPAPLTPPPPQPEGPEPPPRKRNWGAGTAADGWGRPRPFRAQSSPLRCGGGVGVGGSIAPHGRWRIAPILEYLRPLRTALGLAGGSGGPERGLAYTLKLVILVTLKDSFKAMVESR